MPSTTDRANSSRHRLCNISSRSSGLAMLQTSSNTAFCAAVYRKHRRHPAAPPPQDPVADRFVGVDPDVVLLEAGQDPLREVPRRRLDPRLEIRPSRTGRVVPVLRVGLDVTASHSVGLVGAQIAGRDIGHRAANARVQ